MYVIYTCLKQLNSTFSNLLFESIKTEDRSLKVYSNFKEMFLKKDTDQILLHYKQNYKINIENNKFDFRLLYNLSASKLQMLHEYINNNIIKNFIKSSSSSAEALILFIKKKDESLQLCIKY